MTPEIMIVEDDCNYRRMIRKHLEKAGYCGIVESWNGKDALEKLRSLGSIKVIVLDIMMPIMDGLEFLRHARNEEYYAPVIVVTSIDTSKLESLDVFEMFDKPLNWENFIRSVSSALSLGRNRTSVIAGLRRLSSQIEKTLNVPAVRQM